MQLTLQDLNNAAVFLNRVDIKGNEAMAMTELMCKLNAMREALAAPKEIPPHPDPKTDAPPKLGEIGKK